MAVPGLEFEYELESPPMFGQFFELWPLWPGVCDPAGGAVGVVGVEPDDAALAMAVPPAARAAVATKAMAPLRMPCLVTVSTSFRSLAQQ